MIYVKRLSHIFCQQELKLPGDLIIDTFELLILLQKFCLKSDDIKGRVLVFLLPIGPDGSCGCSENMDVQTAEANLSDFRHYLLF